MQNNDIHTKNKFTQLNFKNMEKVFNSLEIDHVQPDTYKPELQSVQIRQSVTTKYPSVELKTAALDLFGADAFNLPSKEYTSTRVAWFQAPLGVTKEEVEEKLRAYPNAGIKRFLSNDPLDVLSEGQRRMVDNNIQIDGQDPLEFFENKLRVRNANGDELEGVPQYANNVFELVRSEDFDNRTNKGNITNVEVIDAFSAQQQIVGASVPVI
jgi:hypothetical protein